MQEKLEPLDLTFDFIAKEIIQERHDAGDMAMTRILESGKLNAKDWPHALKLEILLKLLINQLGAAQATLIDNDKDVRQMIANLPDLEKEFETWKNRS
tara:strand:+ start:366 stop:659 length:294 start_codon:yes stop_codon:yes gene_type:complete